MDSTTSTAISTCTYDASCICTHCVFIRRDEGLRIAAYLLKESADFDGDKKKGIYISVRKVTERYPHLQPAATLLEG